MLTLTNQTVHKCEHCRKVYFKKSACEKHEIFCTKNPINIPKCSGCDHLKEVKKEVYYDDPRGGEGIRIVNAFYCSARQIGLYPVKVSSLGLPDKYPETFEGEIQMPSSCDVCSDEQYFKF